MEFLQDWKFWLFLITILGIVINWFSNQKIMNNDLHHLSQDMSELKNTVFKQGTDIAYIKGILQEDK